MLDDTILECKKCGKIVEVDFAYCLRYGWNICCGETMTLVKSTINIEKATAQVIYSQVSHSREFEVEQKQEMEAEKEKHSRRYGGKYKGRGKFEDRR